MTTSRRLLIATALLAVAGVVAAVLWAAPRGHVSLPGPAATPQQVVRAYVAAINVRDFRTANQLCGRAHGCRHGRFDRTPQMKSLRVDTPTDLKTHLSGGRTRAEEYAQAMWVPVTFDLSHSDASQPDGPTVWGYLVARNADTEPWRIIDQGVL